MIRGIKIGGVERLNKRGLIKNRASWAGNSVLGMQFRTCENFGESTDFSLVLSPKFPQIQKPHRNHFDCDSLRKSTANQTKIAESTLDSANPKHEANSSIVDEFLGLCEASDKDRTKVHRGSEPKHSLKSRHKTNLRHLA